MLIFSDFRNILSLSIFFVVFSGVSNLLTAQNVGINTNNPTNRLHIKGEANEDPIRIESVQKKANDEVYYTLIIDDTEGVVKKLNKKKTVKNLSGGGNNLSRETELYEYYVFDGNYNITITLPPLAEVGEEISFYPWGGGASSDWIFKGTESGLLEGPHENLPPRLANGVVWSKIKNGHYTELTLKQLKDQGRNRYMIHKFICLKKGVWSYVHLY